MFEELGVRVLWFSSGPISGAYLWWSTRCPTYTSYCKLIL